MKVARVMGGYSWGKEMYVLVVLIQSNE